MTAGLLPRARLADVVYGRAAIVGSRCTPAQPRGMVSPVEARINMGIPYGDLCVEEARYLARHTLASDVAVIARALLTWPLAHSSTPTHARAPLLDVPLDRLTIAQTLDLVLAEPGGPRARVVCIVHPHALNLAVANPQHRQRLVDADLVLPDGVGLRLVAAARREPIPHNLNGTDLLPHLCERAVRAGVPLVLIGAGAGIADACARHLRQAHPGLDIPIVSHGFLDAQAARVVVSLVARLGRCVMLVGMGSPLQEAWAWRHAQSLPRATIMTVGGLFDFYSGRIPRAPLLVRELGLEWAFRLAQEPRRMARRYLIGNPLFLALAAAERSGLPVARMAQKPVMRLLGLC